MSRANSDLADELHKLTFETLLTEIKRYQNGVIDPETNQRIPVPPALLAQAAKLLKDNGIDSPVRAQKLKDELAGSLPTFGDVEDEFTATRQ